MRKYLFIIIVSALVVLFFYSYQSQTLSDKRLHMFFCDVGQGDGILIRTPGGADIVIDGGPANGKMVDCLSKHMPFYDRDIELMFATHPDADHIGGLIEVIKNFDIKNFDTSGATSKTKMFKTLMALVEEREIPLRKVTAGDKYRLTDGVVIDTLWPIVSFDSDQTNEHSLVQVISYGNFKALLTGDITYQILNTLNIRDSFSLIKLAHHGSKTGTDNMTLSKIKAQLALISSGKNNSYHHPHPSVLALLEKYNLLYKRTDRNGTVEIVTDGNTTKVVN